jgi:thiol-disulfide isomerase/thioredoxin
MWIQAGKTPVPIKISSDLSKLVQKQTGNPNIKYTLTINYTHWKLNSPITKDPFAFKPEKEDKEVKSFLPPQPKPQEHPLQQKPAPDFTLNLLNGKKFNLSDYKNKNIIILDFWATWCKPCVKALPILAQTAKKYKDKDVIFYAVNQAENKNQITSFLEKNNINCNVILDTKNKAAKLYQVKAIPQTVIIDKNGIIQIVHVGFMPDLQQVITGDLDRLINK